jgi:hypothetical protein
MSESKPLVELSGTGEPAVLDYNVPEPTSYTGRNLIELAYDAGIFDHLPGTKVTLDPDALTPTSLQTFLADRAILAQTTLSTISRRPPMPPPSPRRTTQATPVLAATSDLDVLEAKLNQEHDRYPVLSSTQSGGVQILYAPAFDAPVPGIYLVETYRLSNFLGNYGAGKTIKTFSLLPGEKTSISITSYKNTSSTATSASSIFDSYTEETADDFESAIQSENTATESKDKTTSWNVEAEASGNWGVASVSVSGGASGTTNTAREDFASNVNSATEKHANTASAQRDVEINTNTEETTETGEETAIEREIENINVSRTLNFVFRQMNQEHVSILHLVDVKVAFWNGYPETRMEVPLYDLDRLLEYCVTLPADRDRVRRDVMFAVQEIRDWRGDTHFDAGSPASPDNFMQVKRYGEPDGSESRYSAINREKTSTYEDITVPGLILSVKTNVLRTDGIIVEAVLGEGEALDGYSQKLQDEKIVEKEQDNRARALANEKVALALDVVRTGDAERAEVYRTVFGEPPAPAAPTSANGSTPAPTAGARAA